MSAEEEVPAEEVVEEVEEVEEEVSMSVADALKEVSCVNKICCAPGYTLMLLSHNPLDNYSTSTTGS